jgi:aconitate hydratase
MQDMNTHPSSTSDFGGQSRHWYDLPALFGEGLFQLPVVLRLLLENALRNMRGEERDQAAKAVFDWLANGSSEQEIAYQPGRVLMHDTTSTPALVDIAAMRSELSEAGVDPTKLNPMLPVDVSVDHSLAVEAYARADAPLFNMQHEIRRNAERYRFLRWASRELKGVRINPPGTGIMHTINLEQLATVVATSQRDGQDWIHADMMIGTDSHTPMVNGIGVLGWGVGGLEAQTVMFGMPTMLRIPDVIGVKLTGRLSAGVMATDLALTVTHRLRELGVSGEFVEFFGPGIPTLTAGDRAVVANMAPEYGATTGYFAVDEQTLAYLRQTGRDAQQVALVEQYFRRAGLWLDPLAHPRYTKEIEIDMGRIGMHVAGPKRPQDIRAASDIPTVLDPARALIHKGPGGLPHFPVAIAAITSCTNTSDPRLLIAAGLLARNAQRLGMSVPSWVKTSLAPGSPAARSYLARAGLLDALGAVGFDIVGYGCTTCIGNPGPLSDVIRTAQKAGELKPVCILSGNRNFPGRVHPDVELSFIMSPALVIAFALSGDALRDIVNDPIQQLADGRAVYLKDIWPASDEIDTCVREALRAEDFGRDFAVASRNEGWEKLAAPEGPLFPWEAASTQLRRPPFAARSESTQLGEYVAHPLLVLGDDITTDHISPASAIPPDSLVADFLVARGEQRHDLNVFASRRGNWEVMMRAAFHNKTLVNLLQPGMPVAHTLHVPSRTVMPIWDAADQYRQAGESVVLVAGHRYGTGSSRDWAAKGQRLLGIRCVIANSFERIHRSNLIGMGILPLRMPDDVTPQSLALKPGDRIEAQASAASLEPRAAVPVRILRADGRIEALPAVAAVETRLEVDLLCAGGVIPSILRQHIAAH